MVVSTSLVCLSSSEEQQQKNHIAKIISGSIFLETAEVSLLANESTNWTNTLHFLEQILSLDKGIPKPSFRNNS